MTSDPAPVAPVPVIATRDFASILNDDTLVQALSRLGISHPTDVQAAAIPVALEGGDLIAQAQTGSGKTLAFVLPILKQIKAAGDTNRTLAIVVAPTRELATQVQTVVESLDLGVHPACLIGGASGHAQEKDLRADPRFVVGTPGRIQDFIDQRILDLRACQTFVLDEADEMLSMGFVDDVKAILSRLPVKRQGLFFSATISNSVKALALTFLKQPKHLMIESAIEDAPKIEHLFRHVDGGVTDKVDMLCKIFEAEKPDSAIVFCNTKSDTTLVEAVLKRRGFDASLINSDLSQKERERVLERLRSGELRFLIATDVAARGIDIKELGMVVNYSLHDETEVYVHRTGRTGRAGASGKALSLIGPRDFGIFHQLRKRLPVQMNEWKAPVVPVAPIVPVA